MALSWSMDKIGPIARTVEDCALVFDAIRGADGLRPHRWWTGPSPTRRTLDLAGLRIGYLKSVLRRGGPDRPWTTPPWTCCATLGAELVPVALPRTDLGIDPYSLAFILVGRGRRPPSRS